MVYTSEYFHGRCGITKHQEFHITNSDVEKIKKLVSKKVESSYYNPQIVWSLEDNPQVMNDEDLSRLFICMQFISMTAEPSKSAMCCHQIKDYHMELLRCLYLDYRDNSIVMEYKKPFGNSDVLGDVQEELIKCACFNSGESENEKNNTAQKVLEEFSNFLISFYKDFTMNYYSFIFDVGQLAGPKAGLIGSNWSKIPKQRPHPYLRYWDIDISDIRDRKISKIME